MVEDIFSGLLEVLFDFLSEVALEALGEMLGGIADWLYGGGGATAGPVEEYKFRHRDLDE